MTLTKDLKVKGSSLVLKIGTKALIRRLKEGKDHQFDCRVDGAGEMMLTAQFVKKSNKIDLCRGSCFFPTYVYLLSWQDHKREPDQIAPNPGIYIFERKCGTYVHYLFYHNGQLRLTT